MVQTQLKRRGLNDERILSVFGRVPRHEFVPADMRASAYEDCPLAIGEGQTISQPYMVALITQLAEIKPDDRVLEVGTGSGYQTAILAALGAAVHSIERLAVLAEAARARLQRLGFSGITVYEGDGTLGLPQLAPFDAIVVTAAAPNIPAPLLKQLAEHGRLVIPLGTRRLQELTVMRRRQDKTVREEHGGCVFVPLIGEEGWQ